MSAILEHFRDGGFGMYPTLAFGALLVAVALKYAMTPHRRFVPLLIALNVLTLSAGALGFVTGVITTARYVSDVATSNQTLIAVEGVGESLNNVAFALILVVLAAMAVTLGAWKVARERTTEA
jgi:hypothetical protein